MSGGITYEITIRRKHTGHGKYQWVYYCKHPECGGVDGPTEHPTTCSDADCAEKAAWERARSAHSDNTAVIDVQSYA